MGYNKPKDEVASYLMANENTVLLMFLFTLHTDSFDLQGSPGTVRIGTRSISRDALIIGSLGLLNVVLFFIAVVIGIFCEYARSKHV